MTKEIEEHVRELRTDLERANSVIVELASCISHISGVLTQTVHRGEYDEASYELASNELNKLFNNIDVVLSKMKSGHKDNG